MAKWNQKGRLKNSMQNSSDKFGDSIRRLKQFVLAEVA